MVPNGTEPRVWSLTNTILAALGGFNILLLTAGFWGINNKIETGDKLINERLSELSVQLRSTNDKFQKLCEDVSRIDTYQKIRLDREGRREK
jgi:hypothetical protein